MTSSTAPNDLQLLERLAIAGTETWDDWTETVTRHFRGREMRVYEPRKQAAAWGWVKA